MNRPETARRAIRDGPPSFGRQRAQRLARCAGVEDEPRALYQWPYGLGRLCYALRFRIEATLARRLGVLPEPSAGLAPATTMIHRYADHGALDSGAVITGNNLRQ